MPTSDDENKKQVKTNNLGIVSSGNSNLASFIVSPIAKTYNEDRNSLRDYEEFEKRKENKLSLCWDSVSPYREKFVLPKFFCFVFNSDKVIVHKVLEIKNPSERLESWQSNIGHSDRKVLILSEKKFILDWKVWIYLDGHKKVYGTQHFKKDKEHKLLNFIYKYKLL